MGLLLEQYQEHFKKIIIDYSVLKFLRMKYFFVIIWELLDHQGYLFMWDSDFISYQEMGVNILRNEIHSLFLSKKSGGNIGLTMKNNKIIYDPSLLTKKEINKINEIHSIHDTVITNYILFNQLFTSTIHNNQVEPYLLQHQGYLDQHQHQTQTYMRCVKNQNHQLQLANDDDWPFFTTFINQHLDHPLQWHLGALKKKSKKSLRK